MLRNATSDDAGAICAIYNHYIANTIVTFEEVELGESEMRDRIVEISAALPWYVFEADGRVVGYAYASRWKSRCSYRYSVESTVYLDSTAIGRGVGTQLYDALLADLRSRNYHCVIGGIALPNAGSVALHEKFGFKKVAHFEAVGWKFDRWIDVGYWELIL